MDVWIVIFTVCIGAYTAPLNQEGNCVVKYQKFESYSEAEEFALQYSQYFTVIRSYEESKK